MAQKALFKRELGLDDSRIMTYSVTQNTMRSELIGRIMTALEGIIKRGKYVESFAAVCYGSLFRNVIFKNGIAYTISFMAAFLLQ